MNKKVISERLSKALSDSGLDQRELSKKAHVNEASISHWINARHAPSKESAEAIAKVLNVNSAWLMGFDVPKEEKWSRGNQFVHQTDAIDELIASAGWECEDIVSDDAEIVDYTVEGEPITNYAVIGVKLSNESYSLTIPIKDYEELKDTINNAFKQKFLEILSKNLPSLIEE